MSLAKTTYAARASYSTLPTSSTEEKDKGNFSWKRDIWTIPNALSFTRLSVTPYIGYLILHDQYDWALGISVTCGLTDLVSSSFDEGMGIDVVLTLGVHAT